MEEMKCDACGKELSSKGKDKKKRTILAHYVYGECLYCVECWKSGVPKKYVKEQG